ncbi:hypothetical protein [Ekhidna sp.]|uniref:hypothetical protein n=1 Tax=Ekhidna sp. TaxID=2608089 RepID=UPI003BACBA21
MKKLLFIPMLLTVMIFSSCSDEDEALTPDLITELDADSEAALESNYEDVDLIVEAGVEFADASGRVERDTVLECADVTHDQENKIITIDYGDGCEIRGGRVVKGKIIIEYNDRKLVPGAFRIVTLEDFFIDEVQIEGVRTLTNISESIDDNPTFNILLEGGKLSFPDGTSATRDADHTKTWIRANNPLNDEFHVEGEASGSNREDVRYEVEILEKLVFKRACRANRVFIPVSGIKQITFGDNVAVINYGDGDCDNEVTITLNGETFTRTVQPRGNRN